MEDRETPPTLLRYKTRDKYRVLKQISKGSYGDVFLSERIEDGAQVCLKQVDLDFLSASERLGCLSEVRLLQSLPPHPNVVACFDAFWDDTSECGGGTRLMLALEYGDAGDLESFIQTEGEQQRGLPIETALGIFVQILCGLAFLHRHHILHRDIKSENVFRFSDGRVVIGDFGTSKSLASTVALANTLVGSPLYMSPELLDDQPYSFSADVWSLGCLLYELLMGKTPFTATSYPAVVFKITKGTYEPLPSSVPSEIHDLVARMLCLDPSKRPTVEEILDLEICRAHSQCVVVASKNASEEVVFCANPDAEDQAAEMALPVGESEQIVAHSTLKMPETRDEQQFSLMPPPPPTAASGSGITESNGSVVAPPLPPPMPEPIQHKARRGNSPVFPTTRASIANVLSMERLHLHKGRARQQASLSRETNFLSCVPVMEAGRSCVQPPVHRIAPRVRSAVVPPANPRPAVPPENMLIIGTKVSSVKPTKTVASRR